MDISPTPFTPVIPNPLSVDPKTSDDYLELDSQTAPPVSVQTRVSTAPLCSNTGLRRSSALSNDTFTFKEDWNSPTAVCSDSGARNSILALEMRDGTNGPLSLDPIENIQTYERRSLPSLPSLPSLDMLQQYNRYNKLYKPAYQPGGLRHTGPYFPPRDCPMSDLTNPFTQSIVDKGDQDQDHDQDREGEQEQGVLNKDKDKDVKEDNDKEDKDKDKDEEDQEGMGKVDLDSGGELFRNLIKAVVSVLGGGGGDGQLKQNSEKSTDVVMGIMDSESADGNMDQTMPYSKEIPKESRKRKRNEAISQTSVNDEIILKLWNLFHPVLDNCKSASCDKIPPMAGNTSLITEDPA